MFRKAVSFASLLLLAGATVLVAPGSGQAQHHGGGGRGGGFHSGGIHGGGFNRGLSHSGFHHGFHQHRFNHGFNAHRFNHGFNHGGRWWYPRYYGSYGAWPYYYGGYPYYGYSNYYPFTDSSGWSSPVYDSGYYGSYGDVTPSYPYGTTVVTPPAAGYQAYYFGADSAPVQRDNAALVTVRAPADADIWFNGIKTTSTGAVREYQSPPLTPGSRYAYEVRARWYENGHEVTQTQRVPITAGAHVRVSFPVEPTKARTATND